MLFKFISIILFIFPLYAQELDSIYYTKNNSVMLSDITTLKSSDVKLFQIESNRNIKRIRAKELLLLLKKYGYTLTNTEHRYITFMKKSDIDFLVLKENIKNYYKNNYKNIEIKKIIITPRGYVKSLPSEYKVNFRNRAYLSSSGTINIMTLSNKRVFFDYKIDAFVYALVARFDIRRKSEITSLNSLVKRISLAKFKSIPIQKVPKHRFQAKYNVKKDSVLTLRDVVKLNIVKRGESVLVSLNNSTLLITFTAKALQDGKINDIINIQKRDGGRLKAKVIGKNRVEIR